MEKWNKSTAVLSRAYGIYCTYLADVSNSENQIRGLCFSKSLSISIFVNLEKDQREKNRLMY